VPRSRWLSVSGGISVAYVFVHLLPELEHHQRQIGAEVEFGDRHAYLAALAGLAVFYGLELLAVTSRRTRRREESKDLAGRHVFVLHMAMFALYNAVVAEILVNWDNSWPLFLFTFALAVHFVVVDYGLRDHHKQDYDRVGRYVLAGTFAAGFVGAILVQPPEPVVAVMSAFLVGGIVINVLKEEMPAERESSFLAFAGGLVGYAGLLLIVP
ncbi:MAG: hypothetical protein KY393_07130, partial [Actinobacteria bacterium]|nr:hypothetical protein [Actinomycetota bacterium]